MPRAKKNSRVSDLPVLTESPDADIPVLTEVLHEEPPAPGTGPLTDLQCRQIAEQIAPHLEALLRAKFAKHFDALWEESWHEVEQNLPELIRDKLALRPSRSPK
jgi:hypothetical protein